jgi:hypothetical protein
VMFASDPSTSLANFHPLCWLSAWANDVRL